MSANDTNEVRKRAAAPATVLPAGASTTGTVHDDRDRKSGLSIVEIGRIIVALALLVGALSWFITGESLVWNWRKLPTLLGSAKRYLSGPVSLTDEQLARYDGSDPSLPIYVGLNGSIYDVSASPSTYGPGGGYAFFAGKDATRGFLTGCFQEDLTPDLRGVEEMYIPVDDPNEPPLTKGERKIRRERDMRLARKQIHETIAHWAEVFSGKTGRPYFHAGEIKREEGWLEKLPKRELCAAAKEGRPKRADVEAPPEYKRGSARPGS